MICTLRFNLPDERREFAMALQGADAVQLLSEIEQACRAVMKYEQEPSPDRIRLAEDIRNMIYESRIDVDA